MSEIVPVSVDERVFVPCGECGHDIVVDELKADLLAELPTLRLVGSSSTRRRLDPPSRPRETVFAAKAELGSAAVDAIELICVECGAEAPPDARGWRTYLTCDGEPAHYCPECAEKEFEAGSLAP